MVVNFHFRKLRVGAFAVLTALVACTDTPTTSWAGYAEGDYLYIAPALAGRVQTLAVQEGQTVSKDAPLFTLDAELENLSSKEAAARLTSAQAQADNLDSGKRKEEIAVLQAQLAQAQAAAVLARNDVARQQQLQAQGFVSKARMDDAIQTERMTQAKVAEITAALNVARLPARTNDRRAVQANAQAAQEALAQSRWRSQQKQQVSPVDASVAEVYFHPGEWVPAGQPVVSLLPPDQIKARFYVPEKDLAQLAPGQLVSIRCDGCASNIKGKITRIATQPEYTPPVIYSNAQRAKLVFMVEALPITTGKEQNPLHPGQPLDVSPLAGGAPQ
jgi:HlyD family secretion protein